MSLSSQDIPFRLELPTSVPDGFRNPEVIAAMELILSQFAALLRGMDTYTGMAQKDKSSWPSLRAIDTILVQNHRRFYCKCSENIGPGVIVNFFNSGGEVKARKATNAFGGPVKARAYSTGNYSTDAFGEFIVGSGLITGITGLTTNQDLWLGTNGSMRTSEPSTSLGDPVGTLIQPIGFALGDTIAFINISPFTSLTI